MAFLGFRNRCKQEAEKLDRFSQASIAVELRGIDIWVTEPLPEALVPRSIAVQPTREFAFVKGNASYTFLLSGRSGAPRSYAGIANSGGTLGA